MNDKVKGSCLAAAFFVILFTNCFPGFMFSTAINSAKGYVIILNGMVFYHK